MSVTINDVARKAQVGVGTVSRVINDHAAVSVDTRHKVQQAIQDLNYSPNPSAQRLSTGKTWQIAVILPYLTLSSYVERLRGIQEAVAETRYKPVLYSVGTAQQRDEYVALLSSKHYVDGLLSISLSPTPQETLTLRNNQVPVVLIDACHDQLNHIYVDDVLGGEMATRHLIELGHEKIAYLSDARDHPFQTSAAAARCAGYRRALQQASIPLREDYVMEGKIGREHAREMARKLLSVEDPPSAIFTSCDTQAIGVLDAAREMRVRVPEELSVIGFDDVPEAEFVGLTTIAQPLYESGLLAGNMLIDTLEDSPSRPRGKQLPIELIPRQTTAPPSR